MYHAQFVVRVVAADEAMHPMFFISASREAHAARKHLLIAFGDPVPHLHKSFSHTLLFRVKIKRR